MKGSYSESSRGEFSPLILGINGSPRGEYSSTFFLLEKVLEASRKLGAQTKVIHLSKVRLEHCIGRYSEERSSCNVENCITSNDQFKWILNQMLWADGIVFASPVQWFSMSALMKVLIERLTSAENVEKYFDGKVAGFVAVGEEDGAMMTISQMFSALNFMGFMIPPYAFVYSTGFYGRIHEDEEAIRDAVRLGRNMVKLLRMKEETNWWNA